MKESILSLMVAVSLCLVAGSAGAQSASSERPPEDELPGLRIGGSGQGVNLSGFFLMEFCRIQQACDLEAKQCRNFAEGAEALRVHLELSKDQETHLFFEEFTCAEEDLGGVCKLAGVCQQVKNGPDSCTEKLVFDVSKEGDLQTLLEEGFIDDIVSAFGFAEGTVVQLKTQPSERTLAESVSATCGVGLSAGFSVDLSAKE